MKIGIISDTTYRSCTPDYIHNLSYYGSEPYHAIIAEGFANLTNNEVHFFAPHGSEPIGEFHPTVCIHGQYHANEILDETSIEKPKLKVDYLADFDFIIDFSAICRNIEELNQYHGFKNYLCFRNGYNAFVNPRLRFADRHFVVPSEQNRKLFAKSMFTDTKVAYYGIPDDFYNPGPSANDVININFQEYFPDLTPKEYFLFPHRPTPEKGSYDILKLAEQFPNEKFVYMVSNNPVEHHKESLLSIRGYVAQHGLKNVVFCELPLSNMHHYYKRELYRNAKAVLSPFNPSIYYEGFGLSNGESIACGTPVLITDSESSRELWRDEIDGLVIPYDDRLWGFKQAIRNFTTYSFKPENRYSVKQCIDRYQVLIQEVMN